MPLYLFSSQKPELKRLPSLEREEVVEAAVFSLPITLRGLLTFAGIVLPMTPVALGLPLSWGAGLPTPICRSAASSSGWCS
jgi:hypothetical protein